MEGLRGRQIKGLKWQALVLAIFSVHGSATAQSPTQFEIDSSIYLESAVVIGRRDEVAATLPYRIELVSRAAQQRVQSLTTADALANLSGVYVQKSQLGGGSPVIRGFEANRVLLVIDGVRMNNAIYRSGHLQNAITVDPNALERTEIIYGAGALTYGSDALGGVIHFRTRQPGFRPEGGLSGYQSGNVSSAARAINIAGGLEYGGHKWAALTSYSLTRFGDLRAGGNRPDNYGDFGLRQEYVEGDEVMTNRNPQLQVGSGYEQYNLLQKFRYQLHERLELAANFQFSTTGDVPRYDALNERRNGKLRWARWDYGPQTRALASLRLNDRSQTRLYDLATYQLAYQYVEEDRMQRRLGSEVLESSLVNVGSLTAQLDYDKQLSPLTKLSYGLDLRRGRVNNTTSPPSDATRYPSQGSGLTAGGAYLDLGHDLSQSWSIRGGLRYGYQRLHATFGADDPVDWPADYLDGICSSSRALSGAASLRYRRSQQLARLVFSQGFRAPNVDDFAKFREQSGRIQIPNIDLQPERSSTLEGSYTVAGTVFRLEASVYGTLLTDAIIRSSGRLPNGNDFFVSRGDTLFTDTNINAEKAWIYGTDLAAAFIIGRFWEWRTDVHLVRGRRHQAAPNGRLLDLPQDHIPPAYGRTAIRYNNGRWETSLRLAAQLRKQFKDYAVNDISNDSGTQGYLLNRVGSSDNIELTPDGKGTPAWWTLNGYCAYKAGNQLDLYLKVENMLDRFYQPFASGIAAAGIDVGVGFNWRWGK